MYGWYQGWERPSGLIFHPIWENRNDDTDSSNRFWRAKDVFRDTTNDKKQFEILLILMNDPKKRPSFHLNR